MGCEWKKYRLGNVTDWSSGGTPSKSNKDFWGGTIPWISASSMNGNRYFDSKLRITDLGLKSGSRLAPVDSLLLLVRGSILHKKIQVGIAERDVTFNQDVKALKVKQDLLEPWYLLFWFMSKEKELLGLVENTGIGAGKLDTKILQDLIIDIPPYRERKHILSFVKALDDKIELNRQMNATLEAMAQALFKSWFINFDPVIDNALAAGNPIPEPLHARAETRKALGDKRKPLPEAIQNQFPSRFVFSEKMGWIPEGWEVVRFKQIVEKYIDNRGKTPPLSKDGGIPLVEVKHLPENSVNPDLNTVKYVSKETYESWFRSHLKPEDIVISTVGTIGRICMVPEGEIFAIAQNLLGMRFNKENTSPFFMYYQMDSFRFIHDVDARLVITVQASIKRKDLETIDLLSPPFAIQKEFEAYVKPLMDKQKDQQNKGLSDLRDTLLPKLLSGQLRIPGAEKLMADAL